MNNYVSFIGGDVGSWEVIKNSAVIGEPLESVKKIEVINLPAIQLNLNATWILQGFTSNLRYTVRDEVSQLRAKQEGLNRPESIYAAMIPIKKKC